MDVGTKYQVGDRILTLGSPESQVLLEHAHARSVRPMCLCAAPAIAMYIACVNKRFIVKRMPNSGHLHHPSCESFGLRPEDSGLGQVQDAIVESPSGEIEVSLDFALGANSGATVDRSTGTPSAVLTSDRATISLLGLMHLWWDRCEFNVWHPKMENKRFWGLIRGHLMDQAVQTEAKGSKLSARLYLPERFDKTAKLEIESRRKAWFDKLRSPHSHASRSMFGIIFGELKELLDTPAGETFLVLKNIWDMSFPLGDKLTKQFRKRFADELSALLVMKAPIRLLVAFTIEAPPEGIVQIHTITMMMVTKDGWIPVRSQYERLMAERLTADRRHFVKPLSFDGPRKTGFANFLLTDMGNEVVTLDIVGDSPNKQDTAAKLAAISQRPSGAWVWNVNEYQGPPTLPHPSALLGSIEPAHRQTDELDISPSLPAPWNAAIGNVEAADTQQS